MTQATQLRVRSKISPAALDAVKGKVLGPDSFDVLLAGPTDVYDPAGNLLAKYLPGALRKPEGMLDEVYPTLHELRKLETFNRGLASGTPRLQQYNGTRSYTQATPSAIIGAADPQGQYRYCRLTAWTGDEVDKFNGLTPLFQRIGELFAENVPERFATQMSYVKRTQPEWVIKGSPFTTITVNNSYPTGVHTDKGDLEEGFSNLAVLRRGDESLTEGGRLPLGYVGGIFVFTEYRVGVDMQDGDLLLMDAHQWHGNTAMTCLVCGDPIGLGEQRKDHADLCAVERISIVSYYRTKMAECGTAEEEAERARRNADRRADAAAASNPLVEEMAMESMGG
jgi:hypothetical protein